MFKIGDVLGSNIGILEDTFDETVTAGGGDLYLAVQKLLSRVTITDSGFGYVCSVEIIDPKKGTQTMLDRQMYYLKSYLPEGIRLATLHEESKDPKWLWQNVDKETVDTPDLSIMMEDIANFINLWAKTHAKS